MRQSVNRIGTILAVFTVFATGLNHQAVATTNVLYSDPTGGWYHALQGNSAFYYDPDGPNPNYTRLSGPDDGNQPGGQSNQPALINPGGCPVDCSALAVWQNHSSQWEGSAPGAPLGGP